MTLRDHVVVAIDGPSGSGKSTVSRAVATRLGLAYLDTGAMYRAAALWCCQQGIDLADPEAVAAAVVEMPLVMDITPLEPHVVLDGRLVDDDIRSDWIATNVSTVSTNRHVRSELIDRQRTAIENVGSNYAGIVAEGRDITTVVAPDADVRILLTADPDVRLSRRALENTGRDDESTRHATRDQVLRRDRDDSTVASFLTAADGVTTVDTSLLGLDDVIATVEAHVVAIAGDKLARR